MNLTNTKMISGHLDINRVNLKNKNMKRYKIILIVQFSFIIAACSKDNTSLNQEDMTPPESNETTVNLAPRAFDLIKVTDNEVAIDLSPTFTWQAAVDPEGDAVSYNFYLDTNEDPTTLYAENLFSPNFTVSERLHLITKYHWKVVAKDNKGAQVSSTVNTFTTRNLNFPIDPLKINAEFSPRIGHSALVFKDRLWILGGSDGEIKNDVWNSIDGKNWIKVTPDVPTKSKPQFSSRSGHASAVFDNKIWIIGGNGANGRKNDIWYSDDGIIWIEATPAAEFSPRNGLNAVVYNNKLWVIGGFTGARKNDVWFSSNGITWTAATEDAAFSPRNNHGLVVFDNKMWVVGGFSPGGDKNDVWSSNDGINWIEATSNSGFEARSEHSLVVLDNKMWVITGRNLLDLKNDIWYSSNGIEWERMIEPAPFSARSLQATIVYNNKILVIGGLAGPLEVSSYRNDVWLLD